MKNNGKNNRKFKIHMLVYVRLVMGNYATEFPRNGLSGRDISSGIYWEVI